MTKLSHLNKKDQPAIVDVTEKKVSRRKAVARSIVTMPEPVFQALLGEAFNTKKGAVFQVAIIAGIMAAKKTGELIPLCHPLGLENCEISIELNKQQEIEIYCTTSIEAKTGVEMEALTGASLAALTIYDMCKALSHDIVIKEIMLMEKTGGKRDFKRS
jgi:cyclic pyranopterin phosphate synthase